MLPLAAAFSVTPRRQRTLHRVGAMNALVTDNPSELRYEIHLDDLRARGRAVVPLCPFVAGFIRRHPEYDDLVTTDMAPPE